MTQYGAAIRLALRRALPLIAAACALAACKKDELGPTGVRLEVRTADSTLIPSAITVQWFDDRDRLLEVRVPEQGRLRDGEAAAVSVYIALEAKSIGPRRVLVHGFQGASPGREDPPVSEGAMRLMPLAGQWVKFTVAMEPAGSLADADKDGLPDEIDNCPTRPDPCGDEPPDGAPSPDAPIDAPDGRAPEAVESGVEAPRDAGDGGIPDAPPDGAPIDVPPEAPPPVNGTGVRGDYFDTSTWTTLRVTRLDPTINFDWMAGSPAPGVGADTFSVRWMGFVQPRYGEMYTFFTVCDDGVRLWLNNTLLIDALAGPARMEFMGTTATPLVAGDKYELKVELVEMTGNASCKVSWSSATQMKEVIPTSQLYPPMLDGGI